MGFGINMSKRILSQLGGTFVIENNSAIEHSGSSRGALAVIEFPFKVRSHDQTLKSFSSKNIVD